MYTCRLEWGFIDVWTSLSDDVYAGAFWALRLVSDLRLYGQTTACPYVLNHARCISILFSLFTKWTVSRHLLVGLVCPR